MIDEGSESLDDLIEEFLVRYRRGDNPSVSEFCLRRPDIANEIRELFPAALLVEEISKPVDHSDSTTHIETHHGMPQAAVPAQLGDFRILREIGRGGMGVVYEAEDSSLGRLVALKVLPPGITCEPNRLQRFEREARAAAKLHHSNIVPVLGVGNDKGVHYLVLQLIQGCGLDEIIAELRQLRNQDGDGRQSASLHSIADSGNRSKRMQSRDIALRMLNGMSAPIDTATGNGQSSLARPANAFNGDWWRTVAKVGAQIADALHYAASQGVLHRDIKPSNLLIDAGLTTWITDFGLAKSVESTTLTMSGEFVGTLRYVPPERLRGESDVRGDIYAVGATLYELTTLCPPFVEQDSVRLVQLISEADPVRPRTLIPEIPLDLETILIKAMAKEPSDRYQSAAVLADDLRNFMEDRPIFARRSTPVERVVRWCRRNPQYALLHLAILSLLVLIAVGSVLAAVRLREREQIARKAEQSATQSESERRKELFRVNLARAHLAAGKNGPGQRLDGLQAIRNAIDLFPREEISHEDRLSLRNAAIQCLARADVQELRRFDNGTGRGITAVDHLFQHIAFATPDDCGSVIQRLDGTPGTILLKHDDPREDSTIPTWRKFSPSGEYFFEVLNRGAVDQPERIRVWKVATGELVLNWIPSTGVNIPVFHPDGRRMLVGGGDGILRMFDLELKQQVQESPNRFGANEPSFNADGSRIAVAPLFNASIQIVDPATWKTVAVPPSEFQGRAVAGWIGRSSNLVLGATSGQLYSWNLDTGSGSFIDLTHEESIRNIHSDINGRLLTVWRPPRTEIRRVAGHERLLALNGKIIAASPGFETLAIDSHDRISVSKFLEPKCFRRIIQPAMAAEFSPDGTLLAVSGRSGVQIFNSEECTQLCDLGLDQCGPVGFSSNGRELVTFGVFSHVMRWSLEEVASGKVGPTTPVVRGKFARPGGWSLAPQHHGRHAAFVGNEDTIVAADYRNRSVLLDETSLSDTKQFADHLNAAQVVASADGHYIAASAYLHDRVRVWDRVSGKSVLDLPGCVGVAFTSDKKHLVTQCGGDIEIHEISTGRKIRSFASVVSPPSQITFHLHFAVQPSGKLLAAADPDGNTRLMNYETGEFLANLTHQQSGDTTWIAFSRDGSRLAVTRQNLDVCVWDIAALSQELTEFGLSSESLDVQRAATGAAFSNALSVDRGNLPPRSEWPDCWRRLAVYEALNQNWSDAVANLSRSLDQVPSSDTATRARLLTMRGEYHYRNQDASGAREDLETALRLDPNSRKAAHWLARLRILGPIEARDPKRALAMIALMNAESAPDPFTTAWRGLALVQLGQYSDGRQLLEAVTESDQRRAIASYGIAIAALKSGETELARRSFNSAQERFREMQSQLAPFERAELERLLSDAAGLLPQSDSGP